MGLFSRNKNKTSAATGGVQVSLADGTEVTVTQVVDCLGDSCPRPQLATKKAMNGAQPGDVIEVKIDNPTSMEAIPPMMPELNGTHLGTLKSERYWRVLMRKN